MARERKNTKVVYRKLGKENAFGVAHIGNNKIEVDERIKTYHHLLILTHEKLHLIFPEFSETKIKKIASQLAKFYWQNNFRWVDI